MPCITCTLSIRPSICGIRYMCVHRNCDGENKSFFAKEVVDAMKQADTTAQQQPVWPIGSTPCMLRATRTCAAPRFP